jgi:hypothetical protein
MSFDISFNSGNQIIEARVTGVFDNNLLESMAPKLTEEIIRNGCFRVLIDFTHAPIVMSTLKIYKVPERLAAIFGEHGIDIRKVKRAILISAKDPDYQFLEDVTDNRGQTFKLFIDKSQACDWLLSEN